MFKKLQWKLTFFYTFLLIMVLFVANVSVYKLLEATNNQRLTDEISQLLSTIEGSEWLAENHNTETEGLEEEDHLEILVEGLKVDTQESKEIDDNDGSTDRASESENRDDSEETDKDGELDSKEESEAEEDPEEDSEGKDIRSSTGSGHSQLLSSTNSESPTPIDVETNVTEILIPASLQNYPYYTIHDNEGQLLDYKRPDVTIGNRLYPYDEVLRVNASPELIKLDEDIYYIMAKTPIFIDGVLYGTATVADNVSLAFETLDQLSRVMMIFIAVGSLIAFLIGYILSGRAIKPIFEAYKLKEDFIGNASHEFRTPLSIILLSMDILNREKQNLSELGQETLDDVVDETNKMRQLVAKLLFVARNDANNLVIEEEQVDITKLLMDNKHNYNKIAAAQNVQLHMKPAESYYVLGDHKMLDSVVSTLLDNAVKYNKKNGDIFISLLTKTLRGKKIVEIVIKDTGIGIPRKDHDQIFERFHRQETSRSKEKEGYGLGLSIAKDIVIAHKGHIFVESIEKEYTTMIVQLPLMTKE